MAVNPKYGVMVLANLSRRGDQQQVPGTLSCVVEHEMDVSGASLISVSGTKSGAYHDLMNEENFEHWMLTQLLPNLEEPSVIIMDNTPHHSFLLEKPPTQTWRKDEITAWLQQKRIPFAEGSFKAELLNLTITNTSSRKM
jgi:hypothetical protein